MFYNSGFRNCIGFMPGGFGAGFGLFSSAVALGTPQFF